MSRFRAKEIKHSGPNIGKKVVKKSPAVTQPVKSSSSLSVVPTRPRGRPPKNSCPQKPPTEVVVTAKRKSDGPNSGRSSTTSVPDTFPLR